MAGAGAIRAGSAFVELSLKDSITKGLDAASRSLKSFGYGVAAIGGAVSAAGAGLLAPFIAGAKTFSATGDELAKMGKRTGVSAGALAELGYAAELSDVSMEDLGTSFKFMQKTLAEAAAGEKTAADKLALIGLEVRALRNLSPEAQFQTIADALNGIRDPAERARAALEIFGRSGTNILPLLGDIRSLRAEAASLGVAMSDDMAKGAEELADSFSRVGFSIRYAAVAVGSALAPAITETANAIARTVGSVSAWIRENGELVKSAAKIAAGIFALGGAIAAAGLGIVSLGAVVGSIGAIASAISAATPVILGLGLALASAAVYVGGFVLVWKGIPAALDFAVNTASKIIERLEANTYGLYNFMKFTLGLWLDYVKGFASAVGKVFAPTAAIARFLFGVFSSLAAAAKDVALRLLSWTPAGVLISKLGRDINDISAVFGKMASAARGAFNAVLGAGTTALSGIKDALASGDLVAAMEIAGAGIRLSVVSILAEIASVIDTFVEKVAARMADIPLLGDYFESLGKDARKALDFSAEVAAADADLKALVAKAKNLREQGSGGEDSGARPDLAAIADRARRESARRRRAEEDDAASARARARAFGGAGESARRVGSADVAAGGARRGGIPGVASFALGLARGITSAMETAASALPKHLENLRSEQELAQETPEGDLYGKKAAETAAATVSKALDAATVAAGSFGGVALPSVLEGGQAMDTIATNTSGMLQEQMTTNDLLRDFDLSFG